MSNFFLDMSTWAKGKENKNGHVGLHQTKKLMYSKGHHQQSKKATHCVGEYIVNGMSDQGLTPKYIKNSYVSISRKHPV